MSSQLSNLLKKYNENNYTQEEEGELCEILLLDIWDVYDENLQSLFKTYIKNMLSNCNSYEEFVDTGHDLFCVTVDPELFKYTLTFANKLNVIKCMLEYADGPENMVSIIELMNNHNLTLPKNIVDSTFTDSELKWCGEKNYEELRRKFTKCD